MSMDIVDIVKTTDKETVAYVAGVIMADLLLQGPEGREELKKAYLQGQDVYLRNLVRPKKTYKPNNTLVSNKV